MIITNATHTKSCSPTGKFSFLVNSLKSINQVENYNCGAVDITVVVFVGIARPPEDAHFENVINYLEFTLIIYKHAMHSRS